MYGYELTYRTVCGVDNLHDAVTILPKPPYNHLFCHICMYIHILRRAANKFKTLSDLSEDEN